MSQTCPNCHDHATTLQIRPVSGVLYCPNCRWYTDDQKRIKEDVMFQPPDDRYGRPCHSCGKHVYPLNSDLAEQGQAIGFLLGTGIYCLSCHQKEMNKPPHTYQAPNHPPQVEVVPGALSTPGIAYQLIPPIVWERGAKRFMLGEERKGDKAWNADSPNQHILTNKKFILDRLAHTMAHTLKLMDKIRHDKDLTDDDDAAAIWWGASFAICATEALTKAKEGLPPF